MNAITGPVPDDAETRAALKVLAGALGPLAVITSEPRRAPVPGLAWPRRTRLGFGRVDPFMVVYAPCPAGCGRPTCCLPGQPIPLCLTCEARSGPERSSAAARVPSAR